MKGWRILAHSVRLVFSNMEQALRISLVPYIISALSLLFFALPAAGTLEGGSPQDILLVDGSDLFGQIIYVIVSFIVALWIAVSWHRYVLLEEYPTGWVPKFHGGAMGAYFWRGLLIGLLIAAVLMVSALVVGPLAIWVGPLGGFAAMMIVIGLGVYIFYRLCAVLPAAAVRKPMTFGAAWEATRGSGGTIVVLVVLVVVASLVLQAPTSLVEGRNIFVILYSLIVNWFMTMIGASVLTTFYGHFIENRPID